MALWIETNDYLLHLSSSEEDKRRNIPDPESGWSVRIFSHIHLYNLYLAPILQGKFFDYRCQHFARLAPIGPKIDHDRHTGMDDLFIEIFICNLG